MTSGAQRRLTEAYRRDQFRLSAESVVKARVAYNQFLSVADLDASFPAWAVIMDRIVTDGFLGSSRLAAEYVARTAKLAGVEVPEFPHVQVNAALLHENLLVNGPVNIKQKIAAGIPPGAAKEQALERFLGVIQEEVLNGGRDVVIGASKYYGRSGRWRRVASGARPCAFCAMLAGRGPVYSKDTVDFVAHRSCGCTAELVFGEWEPTGKERLWRASYDLAALAADEAGEQRVAPVFKNDKREDTILWRMRRNSPELFSDGVLSD